MNMLAAIALPRSAVAIAVASTKDDAVRARRRLDRALEALGRQREIGVAGEVARHHLGGVHHERRLPLLHGGQHLLGAGDDEIAAEHEMRRFRRSRGWRGCRPGCWRAAHGCRPRRPSGRGRPCRSCRSPLPSRCAAMPRIAPMVTTPVPPTPVTMMLKVRSMAGIAGSGSGLKRHAVRRDGLGDRLPDLGAVHRHEGRAEAVHAGEVLVAVRLVDLALAAELGLDRLHGDAVRLHGAIAAGLADEIVDDDALVRIRELAALAAAALLGGAGLVVDHHRHAGDLRQLALHGVEFVCGDGSSCRTASASLRDICPARR